MKVLLLIVILIGLIKELLEDTGGGLAHLEGGRVEGTVMVNTLREKARTLLLLLLMETLCVLMEELLEDTAVSLAHLKWRVEGKVREKARTVLLLILTLNVQIQALTLLDMHTLPGGPLLLLCSRFREGGRPHPTPSHTPTHSLSYGIAMGF